MSQKKIRVAINGFGRIGRATFKIAFGKPDIEIVAINDLTDAPTLAHLLQYDSVFGKYEHTVRSTKSSIIIDKESIPVYAIPDPSKLPWKRHNVDIVLECTGRFVKGSEAGVHIKSGARKVILSAPAKGGDVPTYLVGVNQQKYRKSQLVISNASCTTNCISPVVDVINRKFGVAKAMMTTIHSYTQDQRLHDSPHSDLRRARAAAHSIIPTTTGAAITTTEVIPKLRKRFDGLAIRVPTINVSLSDITMLLRKNVTVKQLNAELSKAAKSKELKGILGVTNKELVSSDFIKDPRSSIVDLPLTTVVGGNLVKVVAWYDNEWGYSNRMVDLIRMIA